MLSKPLLTVTKWSLTPASIRHIKTGKAYLNGDVTRDDSEQRFLVQHSVATLL